MGVVDLGVVILLAALVYAGVVLMRRRAQINDLLPPVLRPVLWGTLIFGTPLSAAGSLQP
jgi:hypothetical protein